MKLTYRLISHGFGFGVWRNRHYQSQIVLTIAIGTITIHIVTKPRKPLETTHDSATTPLSSQD